MNDPQLMGQVTSAFRERGLSGRIADHPAWHDLDVGGREQVFDETLRQRRFERALHPQQLSTTAEAVLARIGGR